MTEILSYEEQKAKLKSIKVPDSVIETVNDHIANGIATHNPLIILQTKKATSAEDAIPDKYIFKLKRLLEAKGYHTKIRPRGELIVFLNNEGKGVILSGDGYHVVEPTKPRKHFGHRD